MTTDKRAHSLLGRARLYARLRLSPIDSHLSCLIAWSMLSWKQLWSLQAIFVAISSTIIVLLVEVSGLALDDIRGYRDRSDFINYTASDNSGLRDLKRKPLISGDLVTSDLKLIAALSFGVAVGTSAILFFGFSNRPLWVILAALACCIIVFQYSSGIAFSYLTVLGGPMVLIIAAGSPVVLFYGLLTDKLPALVVIESIIVGIWMVRISAFSNIFDAAGDAEAGRHTAAVVLSRNGNFVFICLIWMIGNLTMPIGVLLGVADPRFLLLLVMAPAQLREIFLLRRGAVLDARRLAFRQYGVGVAILLCLNVAMAR